MMLHYLDEHNIKLQYCQINKQNFLINFCSEKTLCHHYQKTRTEEEDYQSTTNINY